MPLPTPTENEPQDEFITRCMADETALEDFPETEQRAAVCHRQWEESGKAVSPIGGGGMRDAEGDNPLKAISRTDDELRVGNYIVLYNTRDLEGNMSPRINQDGSKGEYFAPDTVLESAYTKAGAVFVDWEHRQDIDPETKTPITGAFGVVDWKTAKSDPRGMWVERILDRRNWYVRKVETLIADGLIGTSSEPVQDEVEKAEDGKITRWPLLRDTMTVAPMEYRMMKEFGENHLQAFKALGIPVPEPVPTDTGATEQSTTDNAPPEATPGPEHETSPEAGTPAVDVAKARARLQRFKNSILEV
jgi:hypothetical protein